jgi:hypothetical protein
VIGEATTERPGSHADPGPAPTEVDDHGYEVDWFDFDEDAAIESAERTYEKWLERS